MAGALAFVLPQVLGGGSKLIMEVAAGLPLGLLCAVLVVKFGFSIFSFSAGVPGGIFLPLLVLGSLCGGVFHGVFAALGMELNLQALVILGMVSCFAAIVRAPVTGILLITEMTGNFSHLLFLSLAALTAYAVADLLKARPIYDQLLRRMVLKHGSPMFHHETGEKVLLETPVQLGSSLCEKKVSQINLPGRCLIISVKRGEGEIVPRGGTVLRAGDVLVALCDENDSAGVQYALEKQCKDRGLTYSVKSTINTEPVHCDKRLVELIRQCTQKEGIPHKYMVSYPAHDAMQLGRLYPMGMIFLRSSNEGVSHCPDEYTTPEDMADGTEVLLRTVECLSQEDILG